MKQIASILAALFLVLVGCVTAEAQSPCKYIAYGAVLTAAQWQFCFQQKSDTTGSGFLPLSGGTMTGSLVTTPATASLGAGLVIPPGTAPTSPVNGATWTTNAGLYVRINGTTVGPLAQGQPYNSTLAVDGGGNLGINLANPNSWSGAQTFAAPIVTGSFTATGLVTNADLANSSITLGATSVSLGGTTGVSGTPISTLYLSNVDISSASIITGLPTPTNASDAATKQYVDNSAVGLVIHPAVVLATTTALPANTYNNGSSGVGATLTSTCVSSCPAPTIDGTAATLGERLLIKNEAAPANNGIYTVTTVGTGSTQYVLTRATDANTPGIGNVAEIGYGTYVLVTSGTVNTNTGWTVTSTVTTIGTSAINWSQFSGGSAISSVSNADGTLTISPTSGAVVASLNSAHQNYWTAIQIFSGNPNIEIQTASTGQYGDLEFYDQSTTKWQLGKDSTNEFYVNDRVSGNNILTAPSNGNLIELLPSGGNVGINTTTPAFDGNPSTFLAVNNSTAHSWSEIGAGGNATSAGDLAGIVTFYNSSLGVTNKRVASIYAQTTGATNSGTLGFQTYNAGGLVTSMTIAPAGDISMLHNLYVGGGAPWVDVKSGANSCAAAVGNGGTNDQSAIQCQINWMIANDPYGEVRFPCGTYIINGGLDATNGHAAGSPRLVGEAVGCVLLEDSANETALTLGNWGAAQAKPGMDQIFVYCSNVSPTAPCVVQSGGAVDIKNSTIQGGEWALVNHGTDGTVFNSYIAGVGGIQGTSGNCNPSSTPSTTTPLTLCYGNLYTDGSNWYIRDKFDQNAVQDISTYLTTVGTGGVSENTFINSDSSDNVRNSLVVFDNGSNHSITAWSGYGPLSTPIYIRSANYTLITNTNMSGGVSNSAISVTGTICGATITGAGTKQVAGNIGTC